MWLWVVVAQFFALSVRADILCDRAPQITPVLPKFANPKDKCAGEVVLQGIAYKCGKPAETLTLTQTMLEGIRGEGKASCAEYCKARGKNCEAEFDEPVTCGFSVPPAKVLDVGKMAPCASHCEGPAFIYCSIYHASYLRVEPEMFADAKPNCHCRSAIKKNAK